MGGRRETHQTTKKMSIIDSLALKTCSDPLSSPTVTVIVLPTTTTQTTTTQATTTPATTTPTTTIQATTTLATTIKTATTDSASVTTTSTFLTDTTKRTELVPAKTTLDELGVIFNGAPNAKISKNLTGSGVHSGHTELVEINL